MATYVVLSKFRPEADLKTLAQRSAAVSKKLRAEFPGLIEKWGPAYTLQDTLIDAIDFVEAENQADVEKAAEVIRREGQATVVVAQAVPWREFLASL